MQTKIQSAPDLGTFSQHGQRAMHESSDEAAVPRQVEDAPKV